MKKIISILLALGLVLGLTVMAAPVAAQTCTATVTATVPPFCATQVDEYNISFTSTVSMLPGNDKLSFEFGAGTTFGTFILGDIQVRSTTIPVWTSVALADIDATAPPSLSFVIPVGMAIAAGDTVDVKIDKVRNPAVSVVTQFKLMLDYQLVCCDPVVFDCADYEVVPLYHTLGFHFDHDKSYTGIAEDFIPPFKACGQNETGEFVSLVGWMNVFDLILRADIPGCLPPCTNATMWFELTKCPEDEVVTFYWDVNGTPLHYTLTAANISTKFALPNVIMPPPTPDVSWENWLHFSSPGDYELCFYLECPEVPCAEGAQIVAEECMPVKVYQWKDAFKIDLDPKWNLISLPLFPFNTEITAVLASMDLDQLMSVWYFDQCDDPDPEVGKWYTDPGDGTGNLDDIEAGKSYWFRMMHPGDVGYNSTLFPVTLWVFGHHAPMPPADPMAVFEVCEGFNMVGFKAPWIGGLPIQELDNFYLWNWIDAWGTHYGVIYSWNSAAQDWLWNYPTAELMTPGVGYWIPFDEDGEIYPKP